MKRDNPRGTNCFFLISAFGIFSRVLEEDRDEYRLLHARAQGVDVADSITVDGHKMLNVVCKTSFIPNPF